MKRLTGFTMAEVLITLGIIGIVSAMTLPAVINRANHYILKQQFKKVYNTYSNALLKVYAENGAVFDCYYTEDEKDSDYTLHNSQCKEFYASFVRTLNINSKCATNAYENGCIPKYKGVDTIYKEQHGQDIPTTGCAGFWEENILKRNAAYVLNDGSIIMVYDNHKLYDKIFLVDINGHKKPNKWGQDLFVFQIKGNQKRVYLGYTNSKEGCTPVEDNGYTTQQMIEEIYRK